MPTRGMRRFLGPEEESISYSQLARSSTSRPPGLFEGLLFSALGVARGGGGVEEEQGRAGGTTPDVLVEE